MHLKVGILHGKIMQTIMPVLLAIGLAVVVKTRTGDFLERVQNSNHPQGERMEMNDNQ